jgi:hypothetical protein
MKKKYRNSVVVCVSKRTRASVFRNVAMTAAKKCGPLKCEKHSSMTEFEGADCIFRTVGLGEDTRFHEDHRFPNALE